MIVEGIDFHKCCLKVKYTECRFQVALNIDHPYKSTVTLECACTRALCYILLTICTHGMLKLWFC